MAASLMEIEVLMFAAARQLTGCDVVQIDVAGNTPANVLGQTGNAQYPQDAEENQVGQNVHHVQAVTVDQVMEALAMQFPVLNNLLPS